MTTNLKDYLLNISNSTNKKYFKSKKTIIRAITLRSILLALKETRTSYSISLALPSAA